MGRFVIVAYTPRDGMETRLLAAVRKHLSVLRDQDLVTDRPAYLMRASDGTVVEIFEWQSADAVKEAHGNPAVQKLWKEFDEVCEYSPLSALAECQNMFAEFEAVEL